MIYVLYARLRFNTTLMWHCVASVRGAFLRSLSCERPLLDITALCLSAQCQVTRVKGIECFITRFFFKKCILLMVMAFWVHTSTSSRPTWVRVKVLGEYPSTKVLGLRSSTECIITGHLALWLDHAWTGGHDIRLSATLRLLPSVVVSWKWSLSVCFVIMLRWTKLMNSTHSLWSSYAASR